jgi:hypothetical protein
VLDAVLGLAGEDEAVGARTCTGASSDMPGRAHRVPGKFSGVSGHACSGQWHARFDPGMVPAGSVGCGLPN